MTHTTTEDRFKEKFCREDLGPEKRGQMLGWFLRDDITGKELLAFIEEEKKLAYAQGCADEAIRCYQHVEDEKRIVREEEQEKRRFAPKIAFIHANFNRNGLVEETANKINEIIEVVNHLSSQEDTNKQDNNN